MDEAKRKNVLLRATKIVGQMDDVLMSLITRAVIEIDGKPWNGNPDNEVFQIIKDEIKRVYEAW